MNRHQRRAAPKAKNHAEAIAPCARVRRLMTSGATCGGVHSVYANRDSVPMVKLFGLGMTSDLRAMLDCVSAET